MHPDFAMAAEKMLNWLKMRGQPKLTTSAFGAEAQLLGALRLASISLESGKRERTVTSGNSPGSPPVPHNFHDTVAGTFSITAVSEWSL